MNNIETAYLSILNDPKTLFSKIDNFDTWLDLAECKKDLIDTLKAFEEEELFEQCIIIKNKIDTYDRD